MQSWARAIATTSRSLERNYQDALSWVTATVAEALVIGMTRQIRSFDSGQRQRPLDRTRGRATAAAATRDTPVSISTPNPAPPVEESTTAACLPALSRLADSGITCGKQQRD